MKTHKEFLKKLISRKLIYLILFQISFFTAFAQSPSQISGIVSDEQGVPLPGVNLIIKDTRVGTITGADGAFSMTIPANTRNPVLVASYLGFATFEIVVGTRTRHLIIMKEDAKGLDEVIVIGYGTTTKRDLTGAVAKTDMTEMMKAPVTGFDQAFAGRVAGVQVLSKEGQPGSDAEIVIRGTNSLTQDNSPLYVIDGFPIESSLSSVVDPGDIESIEVLKDASATAIYGARGANGVIIITTKRGKEGAPIISYDGFYGMQNVTRTMNLMDGYEFVKLQSEFFSPDLLTTRYFNETGVIDFEDYRGTGQDFQHYVFVEAPTQSHRFNLRGGTAATKHTTSVSYVDQTGIILNSSFSRLQARTAIDHEVKKWLKMGFTASYSRSLIKGNSPSTASYSGTNNLLQNVWAYRPVTGSADFDLMEDLFDPEVDYNNDYRINPIIGAKNELSERFINNLISNAYAEIIFNTKLKLRSTIGYVARSERWDRFYNANTRTGNPRSSRIGVNGSVRYTDKTSWTNENILSYKTKIAKKHTVDALVGMTMQQGDDISNSVSMQFVPNELLGMSGLDEGAFNTMSAVRSTWGMMSYLGRVNYNYDWKYYLTASLRADGSSKFPIDNRWGIFPSASVMWRFTKEPFMKDLEFMQDGKIRASWGVTGNNRVTDFASYFQITSHPAFKYYFGNNEIKGSAIATLGNNLLKWEETTQTNIGLDLGFFDGLLTLVADYYHKSTDDLLLNAEMPGSSGYPSVFKNIGKISNAGFELTLSSRNIDNKNFSWTTDFNIAWNKTRVLALAENQYSLNTSVRSLDNTWSSMAAYISRLNEPLSQIYGYIYEGTYKFEDFEQIGSLYVLKPNIPYIGDASSIQPGDMKYSDINGDGIINDYDRTVIGRGTPIHTGGINNSFKIYNFDFSFFWQWSYGNDIINANKYMFMIGNRHTTNMFAAYTNRFSEENPQSDIPRVRATGGNVYSTYAVEDGSFLRLQNITLGYNLPQNIASKLYLSKLRIYATAQNLITLTNYSGMDPEVSVRHSALSQGFDFSAYPRARTISLGVNLILK
jgi:TonB-dependent starch-binding outer membrane protein SusC